MEKTIEFEVPLTVAAPVLALGVFDGVHLGHRRILDAAVAEARRRGVPAAALTFAPHPREVLTGAAPELLLPVEERLRRLRLAGAEAAGVIRFTPELARMAPEEFLAELFRLTGMTGIAVGAHWRFGRGGGGDRAAIGAFAAARGIGFSAPEELELGGERVSSSAIRRHTASGELGVAAAMLGRSCRIFGRIVRGFGEAERILRAPTANLEPEFGVLPPDGVYAGAAVLPGGGERLPAAVNIGFSPTFDRGESCRRVEVHLIGFSGSLYGERLEVELLKRLRDERRFDSPEQLARQIRCDAARTMEEFRRS